MPAGHTDLREAPLEGGVFLPELRLKQQRIVAIVQVDRVVDDSPRQDALDDHLKGVCGGRHIAGQAGMRSMLGRLCGVESDKQACARAAT